MPTSHRFSYALALGSNRALSARLTPRRILTEAIGMMAARLGRVIAVAPVLATPPLGPSRRRYANGAVLLASDLAPDALLTALQAIERAMGRRRHRRWGARTLDIDIIFWSGGPWSGPSLVIPHIACRERDFVLAPLARIVPDWRDPLTGLTVRQLRTRLHKATPPKVDPPHGRH